MKLIVIKILLPVLIFFSFTELKAQTTPGLPVIEFKSAHDTSSCFIFYISGDGGLNNFSKNLCAAFNNNGVSVVFFNSLKYFWSRQNPDKAAADIAASIIHYKNAWHKQQVQITGYSFGGDILPFIYTRLPVSLQSSTRNIALLSPSPSTDFEVHVAQMLGRKQGSGSDVVNELNKISGKNLFLLYGRKEEDLIDLKRIKMPYKALIIDGGHHYDKDVDRVAMFILKGQ
ncbi:MAG: virulence factor family protein [Chitinophagaceae bacterium]|nr:virulence factor family protein [Chitinophagaceae bacterium]